MKRQTLVTLLLICALCFPFAIQAAGDEREVTSTGVGMNEEEAKRQAYRYAIQSLIGAMVVTETLVENDRLIRDKVLSHGDGYITKVEQMGETVSLQGGMVGVTMKVTVKIRKLKEKLRAENIRITEMDGESLFAGIITQQEQARDAAAIMAEVIKDLPANVITATADIKNAKPDNSLGMYSLKVPITVSVDIKAYQEYVSSLKKMLIDLGMKGEPAELATQVRKIWSNSDVLEMVVDMYSVINNDNEGREFFKNLFGAPEYGHYKFDKLTGYYIAICETISPVVNNSRWTFFKVSPEVFAAFGAVPKNVEVRADLLDKGKSPISTQNVKLTRNSQSGSYDIVGMKVWQNKFGLVIIAPGLRTIIHNNSIFPPSQSYMRTLPIGNIEPDTVYVVFSLSDDQLRAVKSVHAAVLNSGVLNKK